MPHKLLISVQVSHEDTRMGYLQPYELVRGEPGTINILVTNIADDEFPGGSISKAELHYEGGGKASFRFDKQLVRLGPSEEHDLSEPMAAVIAIAEGPAWLHIQIEASDSQAIEFYQIRTGSPVGDEWLSPLYVVNREHINIIGLLQAMLKENR